ncbi:hypothetical protein BDY21DRAFT_342017 [Lineolata rhizophorae]|uniref:Peptidase S33 tripeptidyl aminopeptidase-like C-terminal domain-containing protein n=1 Tax=Lineolata rhizophorae TaxID=578093 RepID=A0A6A6P389_9PEZI|nr:hypothetical protein BDY21DRAFT_342017 [Lineolata rhizophorae]
MHTKHTNSLVGDGTVARNQGQHDLKHLRLIIQVICAVLFLISLIPHPADWIAEPQMPTHKITNDGPSTDFFSFEEIPSSPDLKWYPCYPDQLLDIECARLAVPMDYDRPLNSSKIVPTVDIALAMIPGRNRSSPSTYSSTPLLINPGGPGGSGALFVAYNGQHFRQIVRDDVDIIGFDPRGIGFTTPAANCWAFPTSDHTDGDDGDGKNTDPEVASIALMRRLLYASRRGELGLVNSTEDALPKLLEHFHLESQMCEAKDSFEGKENSILRYIGTATVATDMASIADAWTRWRKNDNSDMDESLSSKREESTKIEYWGLSYGTLLGATFAAMFPERIHRMVLDGVVNADQWTTSRFLDMLVDTDAAFETFFEYCFEAGPRCAFYSSGDNVDDIVSRYERVMSKLQEQPISGVYPDWNTPWRVDWDLLHDIIFDATYLPISRFPDIANLLQALDIGDKDKLMEYWRGIAGSPVDTPVAELFCRKELPQDLHGGDAQKAIMCGDKTHPLKGDLANLESIFKVMASRSKFADVIMTFVISCADYSIPSSPISLPWSKDDYIATQQQQINTSFPLLFISNSRDPVTPLMSGLHMADKFSDAGFLELRTEGHTSFAATSACLLARVRAYFKNGTVPKLLPPQAESTTYRDHWDTCEVDEWPWRPFDRNKWVGEASPRLDIGEVDADDMMEMLNAWKELQKMTRDWELLRRKKRYFGL